MNLVFVIPSCYNIDVGKKYCGAGQATVENILERMRFACWITKVKQTHSEYVILFALPRQQ